MLMSDLDNLKFMLELLELMIENFEDIEFNSKFADTVKRLEHANQSLKKAYAIACPIITRKDYI